MYLCTWFHLRGIVGCARHSQSKLYSVLVGTTIHSIAYNSMAKVGYIFVATGGEDYSEDRAWMQQYGCVQVIEELSEHEKLRPMWKQLVSSLERGDELVVSKFSNALRGTREFAAFIEYCRVKVVRIISVQDRIDTFDELFPDTRPSQVIRMIGSLSEECAVLRKASAHIIHLQQKIRPPKKTDKALSKLEREKNIVNMYNEGHSMDDIFAVSGFTSRSSVFRILNKHGVTLNRGPHSGPLRKRNTEE